VNVEEERQPRREAVHGEATGDTTLDIGEPIRQRECQLLRCRGARLADVVTGDGDRIPQRGVRGAPVEQVDDESQRRLDGIAPRVLRHVLLEDVVLDRAAQLLGRHALAFGGGDVEAEEDHRGTVDGHRRRDLVHRDPVEERLHVREAGDRDACLPYLALRPRVIGVVTHQRRKIERYRQTCLPVIEQVVVALVGFFCGSKPRELAHRPKSCAVHRRVGSAGKRKFARHAQLLQVCVITGYVYWRVERFDRITRQRTRLRMPAW
jgi:hypothetical protein